MKLKYKIAKSSELSCEAIIKKILFVLDEKKYGIVNVTSDSILFDDNRRLIVGNWEYARRLHSGTFEVVGQKNSNIIVFEYYPISIFEFIWVGVLCVVPIIFGIINDDYFLGFF